LYSIYPTLYLPVYHKPPRYANAYIEFLIRKSLQAALMRRLLCTLYAQSFYPAEIVTPGYVYAVAGEGDLYRIA